MRRLFLSLLLLSAAAAAETPLPNQASAVHMGARSCGEASCHGAKEGAAYHVIQQNEYTTWHKQDKHAQAYHALATPAAASIARKMGLNDPQKESSCLDCHADNVPAAQRGPRFSLEDGVGCEACHGGAKPWLGDHSGDKRTHSQNVAAGMFPTDEPRDMARLCFRCHIGTPGNGVSHRLLAAGHPRLAIELQTFNETRPAHFVRDADYVRRKPHAEPVRIWATGQAQAALAWIDLARAALASPALFPEASLFECAGCHHDMAPGVATGGAPSLDLGRLRMLAIVADRVAPAAAGNLVTPLKVLANPASAAEMVRQLEAARSVAALTVQACSDRAFDEADARAWRDAILAQARAGAFAEHGAAEQATYSLATLASAARGGAPARPVEAAMDALYDAADNLAAFDAARWQAAAARLADALGAGSQH